MERILEIFLKKSGDKKSPDDYQHTSGEGVAGQDDQT